MPEVKDLANNIREVVDENAAECAVGFTSKFSQNYGFLRSFFFCLYIYCNLSANFFFKSFDLVLPLAQYNNSPYHCACKIKQS